MSETNGTKPGLHAALIAARASIPAIHKSATNPHFKNKYATLGDILGAILPPLHANALSLTSRVEVSSGSTPAVLVVEIVHAETGETTSSSIPLVGATDMQKLGGAMTYALRYAVGSLLALELEDDDDGNRASGQGQPQRKPQPKPAAPAATQGPLPTATLSADRAAKIGQFRASLGAALLQSPHYNVPSDALTNAQADEIGRWHLARRERGAGNEADSAPHESTPADADDVLVDTGLPFLEAAPREPLTLEEQNKLAAAKERGKRRTS